MIKTDLQWTRLGNRWTTAINGTFVLHMSRNRKEDRKTSYEIWIEHMETDSRILHRTFCDVAGRGPGWARMKAVNILYHQAQKENQPDIQKAIAARRLKSPYVKNPETAPHISLKTALRLIGCRRPEDTIELAESGMETLNRKCLALKTIRNTMDMKNTPVIQIKNTGAGTLLVLPWPDK